jgi:hypothetical protein
MSESTPEKDPEAVQRLWGRLTEFADQLPPEEREVLGELLLPAIDTGSAESSNPLAAAIGRASSAGKTLTRIHVRVAPEGVVLAAAGPVAGGRS